MNSEPQPMRLVRILVLSLVLAALSVGLVLGVLLWPRSPGKPSVPPAADFTLTAPELFSAYVASHAKANEVYNMKTIELSGHAVFSSTDKEGSYVVLAPIAASFLGDQDWGTIRGVRCYLDIRFKYGQAIKLRGRCTGMPFDVTLKDCVLIDK